MAIPLSPNLYVRRAGVVRAKRAVGITSDDLSRRCYLLWDGTLWPMESATEVFEVSPADKKGAR
jgi:hypothetical protein